MSVHIAFSSAIYAQKADGNEKTVKVAADAFYKKYLPKKGCSVFNLICQKCGDKNNLRQNSKHYPSKAGDGGSDF